MKSVRVVEVVSAHTLTHKLLSSTVFPWWNLVRQVYTINTCGMFFFSPSFHLPLSVSVSTHAQTVCLLQHWLYSPINNSWVYQEVFPKQAMLEMSPPPFHGGFIKQSAKVTSQGERVNWETNYKWMSLFRSVHIEALLCMWYLFKVDPNNSTVLISSHVLLRLSSRFFWL